ILALHDASDVFLEVGKMSKHNGAESIASFSFVLFAFSCYIHYRKHPVEGPIYYYMFNTLLFCLLVLHIFWWVLIYRMLVKQVQDRGKLSEDVRSDSESDDEHED
ncbi:hypothetical protein N665_0009s0141, partial [Sinapis alba]